MPVSKPFAIATEGPTIDGRNISRDALIQMAANYDPKVYTAVANLEHFLSYAPDSLFSAYGKVVSLTTQEADVMGDKKLQLMAVVDVSDAVVSMQEAGKKLFSSIEITANFINKGVAYLTGLAFTDTPASIGTESMKFSAAKDNIYSFSSELDIVFGEEAKPSAGDSLFSKVKGLLGLDKKDNDARFSDVCQAVEAVAVAQKVVMDKFSALPSHEKVISDLRAEVTELTKKHTESITEFATIRATVDKLSGQSNGTDKRPLATGRNGTTSTDC